VGLYDPFSDDPRLAIHKLYLCALSETLVVGGTAGQVIVMQFEREARQQVGTAAVAVFLWNYIRLDDITVLIMSCYVKR